MQDIQQLLFGSTTHYIFASHKRVGIGQEMEFNVTSLANGLSGLIMLISKSPGYL